MSTNHQEFLDFSSMLRALGIPELQTLLRLFGQSIFGEQPVLLERALSLLRRRPAGLHYQEYLGKIQELFQSNEQRSLRANNQPAPYNENTHFTNMVHTHRENTIAMSRLTSSPRLFYPTQLALQLNPRDYELIPANQNNQENVQPLPRNVFRNSYRQPISFNIMSTNRHNMLLNNPRHYTPNVVYDHAITLPVQFNKLPFYDVVDEVLQPITLLGKEETTLANGPRGMRECTINLRLLCDHANQVTMNRNVSNGITEYPYQIQARICELAPGAEIADCSPLTLYVRINGRVLELPPFLPGTRPGPEGRRSPWPLNLTPFFKLNPNMDNVLRINWVPDEKTYIVGINLVKKLSPDVLLQRICAKGARSTEETKNDIIQKLAEIDAESIMTTSYRVSLVCPLSQMRMKIPAKSTKCDHVQCFDAGTFILMNEKKPKWMCPICNNTCMFDDVRIEKYFLEVVTDPYLPDTCKEIQITADGTWRVSDRKTKVIDSEQPVPRKKARESVYISDSSDDDESGKAIDDPEAFIAEWLEVPKQSNSFIDLTTVTDAGETLKLTDPDVSVTQDGSGPTASCSALDSTTAQANPAICSNANDSFSVKFELTNHDNKSFEPLILECASPTAMDPLLRVSTGPVLIVSESSPSQATGQSAKM